MKEQHCKKCGHKWTSRIERPKSCPACKSYTYGDKPKVKK